MTAVPLTRRPTVVVISDWVETGDGSDSGDRDRHDPPASAYTAEGRPWPALAGGPVEVAGGYLERLPLALVASGIVDEAEIWHFWRGAGDPPFQRDSRVLARRAFRLDDDIAPHTSRQMERFVETFGAPHILVVLGLGVSAALLDRCGHSFILYNSIDAPALRVPPDVSSRFDLVLTGAQWQSDTVEERHPGMATLILPIGPELAAVDQFRPVGTAKDVDLIYVAAAQPYKRHDILFDALAELPRTVTALCVFGYGEQADALRDRAAAQDLAVEFVGPPGVSIEEVNRLMNRARFGVVCGVDDGAPAILTEYMLAGLPVLANADLSCGLQFIVPETGIAASAAEFGQAILRLRDTADHFAPRETALARWTWPHSIERLAPYIRRKLDTKQ